MTSLSRRQFAAASATTSVALATLALGSRVAAQATPDASAAASPAAGEWTFTDDRGRTVTLPAMPTKIFADAGAGLALWDLGIKVVGLAGYPNVFEIPEGLADVPFLSVEDGLDLEAVKALGTDLIVSQSWDTENNNDFGGIDEGLIPGILEVAPTVGIRALDVSVATSLARFEELAGLLGADLTAASVIDAKAAFDAASDDVRAAVAEKPGLKVLALSATPDEVYIGNPASASDLIYFAELGVEFVELQGTADVVSGLFQTLSWEQINQYTVDLYLNDDRAYSLTDEQLLEQPTFALLPAAKAGQIGHWSVEYVTSFQGFTPILAALAETIRNAEIVTG
ncbi:MAG: ABC transporter substrate-binding protein [Thermomicrobiales bacterium]